MTTGSAGMGFTSCFSGTRRLHGTVSPDTTVMIITTGMANAIIVTIMTTGTVNAGIVRNTNVRN